MNRPSNNKFHTILLLITGFNLPGIEKGKNF